MRLRAAVMGDHGASVKVKLYLQGNKAATIYATAEVWAVLRAKLEAAGTDTIVVDDVRGAEGPSVVS